MGELDGIFFSVRLSLDFTGLVLRFIPRMKKLFLREILYSFGTCHIACTLGNLRPIEKNGRDEGTTESVRLIPTDEMILLWKTQPE